MRGGGTFLAVKNATSIETLPKYSGLRNRQCGSVLDENKDPRSPMWAWRGGLRAATLDLKLMSFAFECGAKELSGHRQARRVEGGWGVRREQWA